MKIVRLFDIRWDTDDEDPDELGLHDESPADLGLPNEHIAVSRMTLIPRKRRPTFLPTNTTTVCSAVRSRCSTIRS